jgi:DNA polymerase-1
MSHQNPNTGNIAREDAIFGAEMRRMWDAPTGSFLVGVDAESIQLRVLAHYINDPEFTQSLLTGKKEEGTDPHSLNKKALGAACKSRNDAKIFIYAWLLGAGVGKVSQILSCDFKTAKNSVEQFIEYYPGLKKLKKDIIPEDAKRGYFQGFDGRWVKIVGDEQRSREHFCLAGYLQNGETVVMKHAMRRWYTNLRHMGIPFLIVNFVHDEWQTEVPDYNTGLIVAHEQASAIKYAGEYLNLNCPMAGSILSSHGKIAIGSNWLETH